MKTPAHVRGALVVLVLTAALAPEVRRYRAERTLYRVIAVLQELVQRPSNVPDPAAALTWAAAQAATAALDSPHDPRPLFMQGSAELMARRVPEAIALYRRALQIEERAETELDLGKALTFLGRAEGHAALLRAGWIHPWVLEALPKPMAQVGRDRVRELEQELVEGRLREPPPRPFDP